MKAVVLPRLILFSIIQCHFQLLQEFVPHFSTPAINFKSVSISTSPFVIFHFVGCKINGDTITFVPFPVSVPFTVSVSLQMSMRLMHGLAQSHCIALSGCRRMRG